MFLNILKFFNIKIPLYILIIPLTYITFQVISLKNLKLEVSSLNTELNVLTLQKSSLDSEIQVLKSLKDIDEKSSLIQKEILEKCYENIETTKEDLKEVQEIMNPSSQTESLNENENVSKEVNTKSINFINNQLKSIGNF